MLENPLWNLAEVTLIKHQFRWVDNIPKKLNIIKIIEIGKM